MSSTSKKALISAASFGMLLTQSSSLLAEKQDTSAPEKVTRIAAPIDVDEEVLYSALSDEVLEKAAGSGRGTVHLASLGITCSFINCNQPQQSVKAPTFGGMKYEDRKVPPKGSTGLTVPPKPTQGNKNK